LLLKVDKMPSQTGSTQQGIAIGGATATQITSDFIDSLTDQGIDDLKAYLLEKLNSGEINKS
jgi:hypothetical protein